LTLERLGLKKKKLSSALEGVFHLLRGCGAMDVL
jgi:hypothetical protein